MVEEHDPKQDALERLDKVIEDFKDVSAKRGKITPEQQHELSDKLVRSVDDALEDGPWERSIFLKAIGSKLKTVRDYFKSTFSNIATLSDDSLTPAQLAARLGAHAAAENQIEVFISLYCAAGRDVGAWEKLINTMGKQIVTRPILQQEEDVRALIRSKLNQLNEAYIAVRIQKTDLVNPVGGVPQKDALGHTLLTVKEGCVSLHHITRFLHISGEYRLERGKLVRTGDANFIAKH